MAIEEVYLESRLSAIRGQTKLTPEVLSIEGMSDVAMRSLLNNIGTRVSKYVEVGTYHGSTLIAAAFGNPHLTAIGIDNFSEEFPRWDSNGKPQEQLFANLKRFAPHVTFIEANFRDVVPNDLPLIDCYFYDGAHDFASQVEGIVHFAPRFADECLLLVDDWNGEEVRQGTLHALSLIADDFSVVCSAALCDTWNNVGVFVLRRRV
jgi:hypothetical protein